MGKFGSRKWEFPLRHPIHTFFVWNRALNYHDNLFRFSLKFVGACAILWDLRFHTNGLDVSREILIFYCQIFSPPTNVKLRPHCQRSALALELGVSIAFKAIGWSHCRRSILAIGVVFTLLFAFYFLFGLKMNQSSYILVHQLRISFYHIIKNFTFFRWLCEKLERILFWASFRLYYKIIFEFWVWY